MKVQNMISVPNAERVHFILLIDHSYIRPLKWKLVHQIFPKIGAFYLVLSMVAQHDDGSTPLMVLPDGLKYPLSNKRTCVVDIQTVISVSVVDTHLIFDY